MRLKLEAKQKRKKQKLVKATMYPVLDLTEKNLWQDVIKRIEEYPSDAFFCF
jgi:thioredoxin-like negative regulator of GroEL